MIFVAKKPRGISSAQFLSRLKREKGLNNPGYSGTLDPFASGVLIIADSGHTRLFRFLNKTPKIYKARLELGLVSLSLDDENVEEVLEYKPLHQESIKIALSSLVGDLEYLPPSFSAKHVNGERAYKRARRGEEVELKPCVMSVYEAKFLAYSHPFIDFEIKISEGGYARSFAQLLCKKLGLKGSLRELERLGEGDFVYENERALDAYKAIALPENQYLGDIKDLELGKKLDIKGFLKGDECCYKIDLGDAFSILELTQGSVKYIINRMKKC